MNQPKPQSFAALPTRDSATDFQVTTLLDIIAALQPFVLLQPRDLGDKVPELDGGVATAAATTIINASSRIDAILNDPDRWSLAEVKTLHAALIKTQEVQQTFITEQMKSAQHVRRPSFIHHPRLFANGDHYIAIFGDINLAGAYILGEGSTPAEALADFDAAFDRLPKDQRQLIFEPEPEAASEPIPETPVTFRPKKRKK